MAPRELVELVRRRFAALDRLAPQELETLTAGAVELRRPAGDYIFRCGEGCDGLALLVEGRVRVSLTSAAGRELVLYRVRPGETCVVTANCLVNQTRFPADGQVERAIHALAVPRPAFERLVDTSEAFRAFVFEIFGQRVTDLMELVNEVAFRRLDERLAARLLELGPTVTMSHQELASELGTTREMVSRLLETFAASGAVNLSRRRVDVIDRVALEWT